MNDNAYSLIRLGMFLAFLLGVTIATSCQPTPAHAAVKSNGQTVYIEEYVNGKYDTALRSSVRFVDRYTGSRMVFGKCPKGYNSNCVIIRYGKVAGGATGFFRPNGWVGYLTIEKNIRGGYYDIRAVFDHELGHKFGARHSSRCTNRMYPYRRCASGKLAPRTFLPVDRSRMAVR